MPAISVSLRGGVLSIRPEAGTSVHASTPGVAFDLAILSQHQAAQDQIAQVAATVDSPGSWQALPWPVGLQGRLLYLRKVEPSINDSYDVRLTKSETGQETLLNQRGMLLLEFAEDDYLEGVEIRGEATLEYAATGRRDN